MDELIRVQSRDGSERFLRFDDAMIERVALALCGMAHGSPVRSWADALDGAPDYFRPRARAALHAALNKEEAHDA